MTANLKKLLLLAGSLGAIAAVDWWLRSGEVEMAQPTIPISRSITSERTSLPQTTTSPRVAPTQPTRDYTQVFEAPLFSPSRRSAIVSRHAKESNVNQPEATLVGIASSRTSKIAIISHAGRTRRIEIGERIDGWTVSAIESASVELRRGQESQTLSFNR